MLILREVLGRYELTVPEYGQLLKRLKTMEKKESYVVINGVRYDAVKREKIGETCKQCVFNGKSGCTKPNAGGFLVSCNGRTSFVSKGEVAAQQQPSELDEKEPHDEPVSTGGVKVNVDCPPPHESIPHLIAPNGQYAEFKAYKVKREGGIGKRSYYSFPNGVEAEDICRYLPFNLGNVVKYVCRAGRKDSTKKIEDLMKARDYLDNEIKRLEEGEE